MNAKWIGLDAFEPREVNEETTKAKIEAIYKSAQVGCKPFVEFVDSPKAMILRCLEEGIAVPIAKPSNTPAYYNRDTNSTIRRHVSPIYHQAFSRLARNLANQPLANIDLGFRAVIDEAAADAAVSLSKRASQAAIHMKDVFVGRLPDASNFWNDSGAFVWLPLRRVCLVSRPPVESHLDDRGRLHNPDGPAIRFADGWEKYYLRGINIPNRIGIDLPYLQEMPIEILRETNVERRRVMLEFIGPERLFGVADTAVNYILGPKEKDEYGVLHRLNIPDDEPMCYVEVINSTPEPDGTFKHYWLRVPPTVRTAKEAVFWTHGLPMQASPLQMT